MRGCVNGVMKKLSHIMVSVSVLLLLVFGAGGMGCQRCSCSGRVTLLFMSDSGCCNRGSKCMDVKVTPVSVADTVQDAPQPYASEMMVIGTAVTDFIALFTVSHSEAACGWQCLGVESPPGWLGGNCAVLRV